MEVLKRSGNFLVSFFSPHIIYFHNNLLNLAHGWYQILKWGATVTTAFFFGIWLAREWNCHPNLQKQFFWDLHITLKCQEARTMKSEFFKSDCQYLHWTNIYTLNCAQSVIATQFWKWNACCMENVGICHRFSFSAIPKHRNIRKNETFH